MKNSGLGKGLSALLREEAVPIRNELVKIVDVSTLQPGEYQPRKRFESEKIQELANSIINNGLLQPIIVTPHHKEIGKYKIVAGERRWQASKLAGLSEIPVMVRKLDDNDILKISLLENIQREELSVIEEAEGYTRLIKEFNYTQEDLSHLLGKSRSHVANLLRLNQLPESIKDQVNEGILTMGHVRCLVGQENAEEIAKYIADQDLNVRDTEKIVKNWSNKKEHTKTSKSTTKLNEVNDDLISLSNSLSEKFGVKVVIEELAIGSKIIFNCKNLEELDFVLSRLN
jgi:ParB family transcriptional regulator, chromosome partitioning protein